MWKRLWELLFPPQKEGSKSDTNECQNCGGCNTLQLEIKRTEVVGFRCTKCNSFFPFGFNAKWTRRDKRVCGAILLSCFFVFG